MCLRLVDGRPQRHGDKAAAAPWAAKAHTLLKDDAYLKANEAARLQRLADLAAATSGPK